MASAIALESPDTVLLDASLKRKVDEVTEDTPTTTESVEATESDTKEIQTCNFIRLATSSVTNIEDPFKFASSHLSFEIPQSVLQTRLNQLYLVLTKLGEDQYWVPWCMGLHILNHFCPNFKRIWLC